MKKKKIYALLYRSFDDPLSSEEKRRLDLALKDLPDLRKESDRLVSMRQSISETSVKSFGPSFTESVISSLRGSEKKTYTEEFFFESLFAVFKSLAIAAVILMIVLMSYNMIQNRRFSPAGAFAFRELTLEEAFDPTLSLILE